MTDSLAAQADENLVLEFQDEDGVTVDDGITSRDLVSVSDRSRWAELARGAPEYVREPPVGGQS